MTCKEVGEYIEQQREREKAQYIQDSTIQYRIGQMLINVFGAKRPKLMGYKELFPELNDENNISKEIAIENKWREFLGVVK